MLFFSVDELKQRNSLLPPHLRCDYAAFLSETKNNDEESVKVSNLNQNTEPTEQRMIDDKDVNQ